MASRIQNVKRNIYSGIFNKLINILLPFLLRTVLIKKIGLEYLGLDNLFVSILQVLNLSELGFSSAVVFCLYKPIALNKQDEICALFNYIKKIYRKIGVVVLIIGVSLLPFIKLFISSDLPSDINVYILYLIYLLNSVLSYLLFSYKNSLLNAYQRLDIVNNILTICKVLLYVLQMFIVVKTSNYYLYIIAIPVVTVISNLVTSFAVDYLFPDIKPKGEISQEIKSEIKKQVAGLFISKVGLVSRNSFDSIICSMYLGLTITAIYSNYFYIMNSLSCILIILINSIIPSLGNSIVSESVEKNYLDFKKFNLMYMWITCWATTCLFTIYQPFMRVWVGETYLFGFDIVILFTLYFFSIQMGNIKAAYSEAAGLWWQNRYRSILESVLNILLNILLGKFLGIYGIILATLITIVFINYISSSVILFRYYFTDYKLSEFIFKTLLYAFITLVSCVLSWYLCNKLYIISNEYLLIGISFVTSTFISITLFACCTRKTLEYGYAITFLENIFMKILKRG